ncbi:hypothetical protein BH09ACT4_BH09ACT4_02160 [soil metagenome]
MTLQGNSPRKRNPQTRTQKIVMWCVFGVAAVLAIIAIVIFIRSGAPFF